MKYRPIQFIATIAAAASFLVQPGAALAAPSYFFEASGGKNVFNIGNFTVSTYNSGLTIMPFGSASRTGQVYSFPVTDGAVDAGSVVLESVSTGGMRFSNGTDIVALTSPIVDTITNPAVITFLVTVNGNARGRLALFDLTVPDYAKPRVFTVGEAVTFTNITVSLSETGATILNNALKTNFLTNLNVGTLKVKITIGQKLP